MRVRRFSEERIRKIKSLLAYTDMTMSEIAERMGHSGSAIVSINRKFAIRIYSNRYHWIVNVVSSLNN
jgi:hypothetical protein